MIIHFQRIHLRVRNPANFFIFQFIIITKIENYPAVLCGLSDKLEECIEAIDQNNLEKFKSGHRCEVTGKWIKSPNHKKPNLESIINYEKELPTT